jgi:TetR/AcrR family transcriptional regulator, fatty acid metabolism regulator protein
VDRRTTPRSSAPGRVKIADALRTLLAEKEFTAITTAEIAQTAGVTEGLIYKYFKDKRDLLHQVLAEYLDHFLSRAEQDLKDVEGALNKLKRLVWFHVDMYAGNRIFSRILLLEVRNFPDYFKSDAYRMVKRYADLVLNIVEEGAARGEIRSDVPPTAVRQFILGAIEHACLPEVIFHREIPVNEVTEQLCTLICRGVERRDGRS